jgi:glycosyltransferase involved in cell wall biosynthesis
MLSVVIPVHNEDKNINIFFEEIVSAVPEDLEFELIYVDDGSKDNSLQEIKSLASQYEFVKYICLSKNFGSHLATKAGIDHSSGKMLFVISGDGEEDPKILNKMMSELNNGSDVVWAIRDNKKKNFITLLFYKILIKLSNNSISYFENFQLADYYLINSKVIEIIKNTKLKNSSLFGLISWIGLKQTQISYTRRERIHGKTKWSKTGKLNLAIDWIINFTPSPARFISFSGLFFSFISFIYLIVIIINSISGVAVEGWSSIVVILLFSNGLLLIILGVLSEYVWRILSSNLDLPIYVIDEQNF